MCPERWVDEETCTTCKKTCPRWKEHEEQKKRDKLAKEEALKSLNAIRQYYYADVCLRRDRALQRNGVNKVSRFS